MIDLKMDPFSCPWCRKILGALTEKSLPINFIGSKNSISKKLDTLGELQVEPTAIVNDTFVVSFISNHHYTKLLEELDKPIDWSFLSND